MFAIIIDVSLQFISNQNIKYELPKKVTERTVWIGQFAAVKL